MRKQEIKPKSKWALINYSGFHFSSKKKPSGFHLFNIEMTHCLTCLWIPLLSDEIANRSLLHSYHMSPRLHTSHNTQVFLTHQQDTTNIYIYIYTNNFSIPQFPPIVGPHPLEMDDDQATMRDYIWRGRRPNGARSGQVRNLVKAVSLSLQWSW